MSTQTIEFSLEEQRKLFVAEDFRSDDGEPIEFEDAKDLIKNFEDAHQTEEVLAFHFGLDELRSMIAKADTHNLTAATANRVVGFDFFRCITTRKFPRTGGGDYQFTDELDLVVFPTIATGNLHDIVTAADVPILSHSRPCPKMCGEDGKC